MESHLVMTRNVGWLGFLQGHTKSLVMRLGLVERVQLHGKLVNWCNGRGSGCIGKEQGRDMG